jgi:hypothetical protein
MQLHRLKDRKRAAVLPEHGNSRTECAT